MKPVQSGRDDKSGKPKRSTTTPKPSGVDTAPAALAAAQAFAVRHGLQIVGFDSSGIAESTVDEIAAALYDILGKYPFLDLGGIEITDLRGGAVSRVAWDRGVGETDGAMAAAWIVLDKSIVENTANLAEKISAATQSGSIVAGSDERPMYSVMVHDLGRILEAAAGTRARASAQRFLITEYRRINGSWDRGDTLARIVAGYRAWRGQLSRGCFSGGRFDARAGLVGAFAEVELRGADACGPAGVLHRLVVECARGRASG
ncbi:hypothetical protein [Nocardia sp. NBC_00403]|uniref:hypothetical protein n=1 Tax=Nocardia sp. NBC_00403 TaxID=2975990 RepID=UPI002E1F05B4